MNEKQEHEDMERVKKSAEALGEYFDSVQIFATRYEGGTQDGTVNVSYGCGNWFARYGKIRDWLIREEEYTRVLVRKKEEES